ncbi:hypothetical protein FKW77_000979 [Venturia effusa]|uniref:TM7S3/TM198-like domain-containing protein n=1 Tax=Venturia effusa TaxID=50376 RepID=A0A517L2Q7_9PEZI|nr:hypothetical protein FKW77_000979 [Venturia effusa]
MKLLLVLLWSLAISTSTSQQVLHPRQDSVSSTDVISTTSPASTASNTPRPTSGEGQEDINGSATSSRNPSSSSSAPTSKADDVPSASETTTQSESAPTTPANGATRGDPIPLPLQPKITPAIGFAGAVLMITGLAYTLVGIKNQWLYSFFGVAYLVSLATTVLIIYCMNPPVSDGVQGAFVVAVIFAGSIAGGVALIFRDLADGVGCLIGGFCLAMWFLCLKAGGLIPSVVGKAVFIGCISFAVFSLAISTKTRKYGLIGSIPFSGATVTILGIDCFSRAGLKEFWIYIWDINENEFPLNTNTYPMTRGIKVEVAGIILLFLLGLTTQFKLAKVVEQRREQKNAHRVEQEKDLEREETAAGQRVEQDIQNERLKWESIYGEGKSQTTTVSGTASMDTLGKSLGSVREKRASAISSMELSEISSAQDTYGNKQSHTTATAISPSEPADEIRRVRSSTKRLSTAGGMSSKSSRRSARLSASPLSGIQSAEFGQNSSLPSNPEAVPLAFKIPDIEFEGPRDNSGSPSAIKGSYLNGRRPGTKRDSGTSFQTRSMGSVPETTVSEKELVDGYESDRDLSVAGILEELDQDDMSLSAMTVPRSPMDADFGQVSPVLSHRGSFDPVSPVDVPLDISTSQQTTPLMPSTSWNTSAVRLQPAGNPTNTHYKSGPMLDPPLAESPIEFPIEKGRAGKMKKVGSDIIPPKETPLTQRDSQSKSKPKPKRLSSSTLNSAQGGFEKVSSSQRRQESRPGPVRTTSRQDTRPVVKQFDSHQPLRAPNAVSHEKRADLMNGWRQALRQEQHPQALIAHAPIGEEARMARLLQEKRQQQFMAEQEQIARATRDNTLDHMMRNGNMIDVHRQRLRNMQAGAKIL